MRSTLPDLLHSPKRSRTRAIASGASLFHPEAFPGVGEGVVGSGLGGVDVEPKADAAPPRCASCPVAHLGTDEKANTAFLADEAVRFESAVGGSYGRVRVKSAQTGKGVTGMKRGICRGFSRASAARLRALVNSVNRELVGMPQFITLTYHEVFPPPDVAKQHLKRFKQALQRLYPELWGVWKLEPQERGAPHFHLLTVGCDVQLADVVRIWHAIAGCGSDLHRRWHLGELGNRPCVERATSWERVRSYLSKYFAKPFDDPAWECFGRGWGEIRRLNRGKYVQIESVPGPASAVPVMERALRRHREAGGISRAFLRVAVRNEDGSVEFKHLAIARIPEIQCRALVRQEAGKPIGFWASLLQFVHADFSCDLSDNKQRKAFKRDLLPERQGGRCCLNNVKISLHFRRVRAFSTPVKRQLLDGSEHVSRVQRASRSSMMLSSESLRLWRWACDEGRERASGGRRYDHSQADIESAFDSMGDSPLSGQRWCESFNR